MNKYIKVCLIISFVSANFFNYTYSQTAEVKGLSIAQSIVKHDQGWLDVSIGMKMVLRNKQGDESVRDIHIKVLEVTGDGDKSLATFNEPRDVKGTSFLSYSHVVKEDDQWLYLPALKRVKRISSANKSGPFMGSEFAYEDFASFEIEKYTYKYIRDEEIDGIDSSVIEQYPGYKNSGYTRRLVWVDKLRHIPLKIEFYDRKNDLLKVLSFKNYKQYIDKYWRASEQTMENKQNGKVTVLSLNNYQFSNGYSDRDFARNSLKRAK